MNLIIEDLTSHKLRFESLIRQSQQRIHDHRNQIQEEQEAIQRLTTRVMEHDMAIRILTEADAKQKAAMEGGIVWYPPGPIVTNSPLDVPKFEATKVPKSLS